jgi:spore germination protein KC
LFLSFGGTGVESQYIVSTPLFAFYRNAYEPGTDSVLPVVKSAGDHFEINHAVVFKDRKAALTMTDRETRLYNILKRQVDMADLEAHVDKTLYAAHINDFKVKYHLEDKNGITIGIKIKLTGMVEERSKSGRMTEDKQKFVGNLMAADFKKETEAFLKKLQDQRLDPLDFGLLYRARHWDEYKTEVSNWQKLYPKAKFDVQVNIHLVSSGTIL